MEALREQGPDGPVGKPRRKDGFLSRAPLPAEEAAGDLARRVETFFVLDGKGQKVDIRTGFVGHYDSSQQYGVAVPKGDGPVGLESELTGFYNQLLIPDNSFKDCGYSGGRHDRDMTSH
jgi:hypothetical protein